MAYLIRPKLAFLVHTLDIWQHYQPILEQLHPLSFELVIPDDAEDALLDVLHILNYRFIYISELLQGRMVYKYFVTDHYFEQDYKLMDQLGSRQIRFIAELGRDHLQLANWNKIYDAILCYGGYQTKKLKFCRKTPIFEVGYPRFDRYWSQAPVDRQSLLLEWGADLTKPTVLWMPCSDVYSSVELFADAIGRLREHCNILVKPHVDTVLHEPDRLEFLYANPFTRVLGEMVDDVALFQVSDYVLADYGHAPFQALYTDRNLLLLNHPLARDHEDFGRSSSDLKLRDTIRSLNFDESHQLLELLADELYWRDQKGVRQSLRNQYFGPHFGSSTHLAVDVLEKLIYLLR